RGESFVRKPEDAVRGLEGAQNAPAATHAHAFAECDLGGHSKSQLNLIALAERSGGEKKYASRTEVLGKPDALGPAGSYAKGNWKQERETLSNTAFNLGGGGGHGGDSSL